MIRPAHSFRRRLAVGSIAIGVAAIAPIASSLQAGATPGDALGAVNVHAVAVGIRVPAYEHQGEDGEAEVPFSLSDLGGGGVAHALTSFLWPGATGAALGSTIGVLTDKIPQQVLNLLDYKFKAEAPTTTGDTSVSLSQPGFIMQALALPTHVNSSSALGLSDVASFKDNAGPLVSATTNIGFKGADTVVADATSALTDITVGPLTIGSIVSTVHATSDGKRAAGTTSTDITGATIAGVGVTIGPDGVKVADQGALPPSVFATLTDTVNKALAQSRLKIFLTPASKLASGPQISLSSSEIIVMYNKADYRAGTNDTGILMELGNANITANASGGYVAPVIPTTLPTTAPTSGGNSIPGIQPPSDLPPSSSMLPPTTAPPPALAANPLSLPGPLSSWWIVVGVALALLASYLLSLLPSRAFVAAASCRLEEE